jgi:hypothetical protein
MYATIPTSYVVMDANDLVARCNLRPTTKPVVTEGIKAQIAKYITDYNAHIQERESRDHISNVCRKIISDINNLYSDYKVPGRISVWLSKTMTYDEKIKYDDDTEKMKIDHFRKTPSQMIYEKLIELEKTLSDPIQKHYLMLGIESINPNDHIFDVFIPYPEMPKTNRLVLDYMDIIHQIIKSGQATLRKVSDATVSDIHNDIDHPIELTDTDPLIQMILNLGMKYQIDISKSRMPKYSGHEWQEEIDRIGGDDDDRDVISVVSTLTITI